MQASNVDDHHVAHQLPVDQHNQAHIAKLPVRDDGCAVLCQHGINHRLPGVAQHNASDEVRHEEHGAEKVRTPQLTGQYPRDGEGEHIDSDHRHHNHQSGEAKGRHESFPLTKGINVVLHSVELRVSDSGELGKR